MRWAGAVVGMERWLLGMERIELGRLVLVGAVGGTGSRQEQLVVCNVLEVAVEVHIAAGMALSCIRS